MYTPAISQLEQACCQRAARFPPARLVTRLPPPRVLLASSAKPQEPCQGQPRALPPLTRGHDSTWARPDSVEIQSRFRRDWVEVASGASSRPASSHSHSYLLGAGRTSCKRVVVSSACELTWFPVTLLA